MKNRTLILHNQIVWGKEAEEEKPLVPDQKEQSQQQQPRSSSTSLTHSLANQGDTMGDQDDDDPNRRKTKCKTSN